MLKPGLQLSLGQQLAMTPQLQQAIRLLQLSAQELEIEIHSALESNVMLQAHDDPAWDDVGRERSQEASSVAEKGDVRSSSEFEDRQHITAGTKRAAPASMADRELESVEKAPLHSHLLWQLEMSSLSPRDLSIGVALIDALDDDGYFLAEPEDIREALEPDIEVETDEVVAVLHHIQMLDPAGVGARNLTQSLHLQLRQFSQDTPGRELAEELIVNHLDSVAQERLSDIEKQLNVDRETLSRAVALIRSLDPRPGRALAPTANDYIVPDVNVTCRHGEWRVELNSAIAPRIGVNAHYASLLQGHQRLHGNAMLKNDLREARWLIRSLEMRHQTLLKVAKALVKHQQAFLEHGEEYMQPLILRDIAEEIEVHESTVSRVTTSKFMQTPRGVVSFKYFFSNHLVTDDGQRRSVTAIRALIKKIIANEDDTHPLSDGVIADQLHEQDIPVARRTVAKYREALGIPAKSVRRQRHYVVQPDRLVS